jgi:hypothetical protein
MRKLKLDLDDLQVDSFIADSPASQGRTVLGRVAGGDPETIFEDNSTGCDGRGWGSLFGTCAGCPTVGTCVGPTYCCQPTWRPTCADTCQSCYADNPCSI